MKRPLSLAPLLAVLITLAGCAPQRVVQPAPPPTEAAPAAVDRTQRPGVEPAPGLDLPPAERFTLANGLTVLVMEKPGVPLVQMNLVVGAGSVDDPAAQSGLAHLTADMLDEGAAGRSALELADEIEWLGARFFIAPGQHATTLGLRVPVARMDPALALMADVVLRPDFPAEELERLRLERLTSLIRRHDEPRAIADVLFNAALFGPDHPYGLTSIGDEAALRGFSVDDLRAFHQALYRPGNATMIVVGDIEAGAARALVERVFGGWEGAEVERPTVAEAPQVTDRTIYLVDKPGAAQSVVRIGRIGVPRSTEDYYALEVLNTILGGSFTSRLNQNLREQKGYTYGAFSRFDYRLAPGPFLAGADVQTAVTGPALEEFMRELTAIRETVTDEEVDLAKSFLAMRYPATFQSVSAVASHLAETVLYGLPRDYFNRYTDRIQAVTRADVERVAARYLDPEHLALIVVGDRSVIEEEIRALDLGAVRVMEVTDVLGAVPALGGAE